MPTLVSWGLRDTWGVPPGYFAEVGAIPSYERVVENIGDGTPQLYQTRALARWRKMLGAVYIRYLHTKGGCRDGDGSHIWLNRLFTHIQCILKYESAFLVRKQRSPNDRTR